MNTIITWIEARLAERSTWIGAISLLAAVGVSLDPSQAALIASVGAAIGGALMVFTRDRDLGKAILTVIEEISHPEPVANTTVDQG